MKVIHDTEKTPSNYLTYSECYEVKYRYVDFDGYEKRNITKYFSTSKGAHKFVEAKFKKDHPKAVVISIKYQ
jgi:hypothetical protein